MPLIAALRVAYPNHRILLTSMTATGRAAGATICRQDPRIRQAWLPYDLPGAAARFLTRFRPVMGILLETEIWPTLVETAARLGVPLMLVNARLSRRSARAYAHIAPLMRPVLAKLTLCLAQSRADARRLAFLGAARVEVAGNLKFDMRPDPALLALGTQWASAAAGSPARAVWLAASTREGEESQILAVQQHLRERLREAAPLLVLVPRHPERFEAVARLVEQRGFVLARRSLSLPMRETAVWLGDSVGEMPAYYRLASIAFIGGSLLPLGGQNLIEAAAAGCPVLVGPHTFNFAKSSEDAIRFGAAERVTDADALADRLVVLVTAPEKLAAMREAAAAFSRRYQGATAHILASLTVAMAPGCPGQ
jgi:3-deoxy-D-manno-octulosonic-acid transferase